MGIFDRFRKSAGKGPEAAPETKPGDRAAAAKPAGAAPVSTVTVGGVEFPLARDVDTMSRAIAKEGRCILRMRSLDYGRALGDLMTAMDLRFGKGAAQTRALFAAPLLCAGCQVEYPGSFRLALQDPNMFGGGMVVMGGAPGRESFGKTGRCPKCGNPESFLIYQYEAPSNVTSEDVEAIRDYWRDLATAWWTSQSRSQAICDYCNGDIAAGQGYLSGSSLICDDCVAKGLMAEGLEKLRQDQDYYGGGLLLKARAARTAKKR